MIKVNKRTNSNLRSSKTQEFSNTISKTETPLSFMVQKKTISRSRFESPLNLRRNLTRKRPKGQEMRRLSLDKSENKELRRDAKGHPIIKGSKKFKVTFKDLISKENLVEYVIIEDYKKYHNETFSIRQSTNGDKDDNTSCACNIF